MSKIKYYLYGMLECLKNWKSILRHGSKWWQTFWVKYRAQFTLSDMGVANVCVKWVENNIRIYKTIGISGVSLNEFVRGQIRRESINPKGGFNNGIN